jgi:hypothetical protein
MDFKEGLGTGFGWLRIGSSGGFFHNNEPSVFMRAGKFHDQLRVCKLLKKD